jgi:hypothetical protein
MMPFTWAMSAMAAGLTMDTRTWRETGDELMLANEHVRHGQGYEGKFVTVTIGDREGREKP